MKKIIQIIFCISISLNGYSQNKIALTLGYGANITTITNHELELHSPNFEKTYFTLFSPFKRLSFEFSIENRKNISFIADFEIGDIYIYKGFSIKATEEHDFAGFGILDGFGFFNFSIGLSGSILNTEKITMGIELKMGFVKYSMNPNLDSLDIQYKENYDYDLNQVVGASTSVSYQHDFSRLFNLNIGVDYFCKFNLKKNFFIKFNLGYRQGLFNIYKSFSHFTYQNFIDNSQVYYEHEIRSKLSHFNSTIGLGYNF